MWQRGRDRSSNLIGLQIGMFVAHHDMIGIEPMAAGLDPPSLPALAIFDVVDARVLDDAAARPRSRRRGRPDIAPD